MPDLKEITSLSAERELHTCPDCGYGLGFHTSFVSATAPKGPPVKSTREVFRVILICPDCGARFDIGWLVSFSESENLVVKTPVNTATCVPHGSPAACLPALPPHDNHSPE